MSQIVWEINGLSFELDIEDYETSIKYKKAFEQMETEEKMVQKDGDVSDFIKSYCTLYWNVFDNLFGEGTAKALFGDKYNIRVCEEIYDDFLEFVRNQRIHSEERRNSIMNKYVPQENRFVRRGVK